MSVQVLYSSKTGNTEQLAKVIFKAIPMGRKDIQRFEGQKDYEMADIYFVGYWTDRGSASFDVLDYLGELHNKKIALFGTCGMGGSEEYYKQIEENIKAFISDDNEYLGAFMCQGKMPIQIRDKYEGLRTDTNQKQIDAMIRNFDEAILHPDKQDLLEAEKFVANIFKN